MKKLLAILCLYTAAGAASLLAQSGVVVRFHTSLGDIDVQLDSTDTPENVANFLYYVVNDDYTNSFIHRSVPGFVIQGGGFYVSGQSVYAITTQAPVPNEYKVPNKRGTIAMALTSESDGSVDPNSATSQWFFNLVDNSSTLGSSTNGYFTVFGQIIDSYGLAVMDAIANLPVENFGTYPYEQLPVINYTSGNLTVNNFVYVTAVTVQPAPEFFTGEAQLASSVYYLSFANGNFFGYFGYYTDPHFIYHYDMGWEYCFDAADGNSGIYFYDFTSGHFFYTSPTFGFPYVYDFTLNSVLYYYPNPDQKDNPGHYNRQANGKRQFYDFATKKVITQ